MINLRCTDDDLRELVASNPDPIARSAASELLALRAERKRDSRRAEQVKKLRWALENVLAKTEDLTALMKQWEAEEMAKPDSPR